jgi:hypothetical protein
VEGKLRQFRGEYSTLDREIDDYRGRMAAFVDGHVHGKAGEIMANALRGEGAVATRASAKLQGFTAQMTMGYAPIKAAVNLYGGTMHTIIKTSFSDFAESKRRMKDPEFAKFVDEQGWKYGQGNGLANEIGADRTELWKPLGLFQAAEAYNRKMAFAAAYVKATAEGHPVGEATEIAVQSARLTQGIYTATARPGLISGSHFSGPLLNTSFQFKQYMVNEARFMKSLTPKEWALYVPYILAAGGTKGGITIAKSVIGLAGAGAILDTLNEKMNIAMPGVHRGIPGLLGLDLSAPVTWQLPNTAKEMLGKPISDLISTLDALRAVVGGGMNDREWSDYVRQIAPTMYSLHKGFQTLSEGRIMKGTHTQQIVPKNEMTKEAIINFLGARSTRESAESDTLNFLKVATRENQAAFSILLDRVVGASSGVQAASLLQKAAKDGILPQSAAAKIMNAYKTRQLPLLLQTYQKAGIGVKVQMSNMGYQPKF